MLDGVLWCLCHLVTSVHLTCQCFLCFATLPRLKPYYHGLGNHDSLILANSLNLPWLPNMSKSVLSNLLVSLHESILLLMAWVPSSLWLKKTTFYRVVIDKMLKLLFCILVYSDFYLSTQFVSEWSDVFIQHNISYFMLKNLLNYPLWESDLILSHYMTYLPLCLISVTKHTSLVIFLYSFLYKQ